MHGRWVWVALAFAVAACGGSSGPVTGGGSDPDQAPAATEAAMDPGAGGGVDAPVTVAVGGTTWGFDVGTCDVADGAVSVSAGRSDGTFASADTRISPEGGATLTFILPAADGGAPLQLAGGDALPGTSWDLQVEGTTAVVEATLADEGSGGGAPVEATITIRCAERGFGGMAPPAEEPPAEEPPPAAEEPAATAVPPGATITLDLGGSVTTFDYFGCPLTEPELMFVIVDVTMTRLAVVRGEAQIDLPDGTRYRAQGVDFGGSDASGTWSGTMASPAGDVPATITVACG